MKLNGVLIAVLVMAYALIGVQVSGFVLLATALALWAMVNLTDLDEKAKEDRPRWGRRALLGAVVGLIPVALADRNGEVAGFVVVYVIFSILGAVLGIASGFVLPGRKVGEGVRARRYAWLIGAAVAVIVLWMASISPGPLDVFTSGAPVLQSRAVILDGLFRLPLGAIAYALMVVIAVKQLTSRERGALEMRIGSLALSVAAFIALIYVPWANVLSALPGMTHAFYPREAQFVEFLPGNVTNRYPATGEYDKQVGNELCEIWLYEFTLWDDRKIGVCYVNYLGRLMLIEADGSARYLVQREVIWDEPISMSPDGQWVAFSMAQGSYANSHGLAAVHIDSRNVVQITRAPLFDPVWLDNGWMQGDYIAWVNELTPSARYVVPLPDALRG
jgi:hypothetical protein